jgi:hypothetical protein
LKFNLRRMDLWKAYVYLSQKTMECLAIKDRALLITSDSFFGQIRH